MSKVKFSSAEFPKSELDEVCTLLARLVVHADEDCPSEYRTHHFREALDDAVDYLKESGWVSIKTRGERANERI